MDNKSFDHKRIAKGYANRPWLHKSVIEQIKADYAGKQKFENGLDVGCGAGLSTKALKLICEKVTGTDIAESMIQACKEIYQDKDYCFYTAAAEVTKCPVTPYDIVTAAGVINWVDKERFLKSMNEVMAPKGLLVIYDFWISNRMVGSDAYTDWYQNAYLQEFPKPVRDESVWSQHDVGADFILKKQITYEMQYDFNLESFIDFMMIQSNVNTRIAGKQETEKQETEKEVRSWMQQTLQPIFGREVKTLIFDGYSWYIEHV